jgi:hypothetical protein
MSREKSILLKDDLLRLENEFAQKMAFRKELFS